MNKIKNNKGITMITLIITIAIIIILVGNISINIGGISDYYIKGDFENDIKALNEEVEQYYMRNKELPILNKYINVGMIQDVKNINDNDIYYVIDISKLNLKLKYGNEGYERVKSKNIDEEITDILDVYIINEQSHTIYYPKGIEYDEKINYMINISYEKIEDKPDIPSILDELKVGSEVTYSSSGTYNWQAKYCSSTKTETTDDVILNSNTGEDFNIVKWKVLSIDKETGKVELVPSEPTKGEVYLGEAQGYNNGVKLLNDACSSLYSDASKGIEARSINIEDIEKVMDYDPRTYVNNNGISYGKRWTTIYGSDRDSTGAYITHKNYPVMYGDEANRTINETTITSGLGLSEQNKFIERNAGTPNKIGTITTQVSIHPRQTYYYLSNSDFENKLVNYKNIILPKGTNTYYWVASRCMDVNPNDCNFNVHNVYSGCLSAYFMYGSNIDGRSDGAFHALFPVVYLNSNLIETDITNGFVVK